MKTAQNQISGENVLSPSQIIKIWEQAATVINTDPFIASLAQVSACEENLSTELVRAKLEQVVNDAADAYRLITDELNKTQCELSSQLSNNLSQILELTTKWHVAHIFMSARVQQYQSILHYQEFRDTLNEQVYKLVTDMIIEMRASSYDLEPIVEILQEVLFTLESGSTMRNLHFYLSKEYLPQAGDIIEEQGHSVCFLSNPKIEPTDESIIKLTGPAVAHNYHEYSFKHFSSCLATFTENAVVSRGDNAWLAFTKDGVRIGFPKVTLGMKLQRRAELESGRVAYERGQVTGRENCNIEVLWISEEKPPYLETIDTNSQEFKRVELWVDPTNRRYLNSLGDANSNQLNLSPNIFLPDRLPQLSVNSALDYTSSEFREICEALELAKYPIVFKQWGYYGRYEDLKSKLDDLTIVTSQNFTIQKDAKALRAFGCLPLLIINGAYDDNRMYQDEYFKKQIEAMQKLGWEVLIWQSDYNYYDNNLSIAVDALKRSNLTNIHFIKGDESILLQKVKELGAIQEANLTAPVLREVYQRPMLRRGQAYSMQELLNISDAQVENSPSVRLRLTAELLAMSQKIANADPKERLAMMDELLKQKQGVDYSSVVGRTRLETDLCMYDFINMSKELARSRLPLDHPAIAIRGITCGDLSPQALSKLYHSGANFYTVRSELGHIDGIAITFPPNVTDRLAPGLSEKLNAPEKTGYLYWIWTTPDEQSGSRVVYHKLVSAFLLEQVVSRADLAAGAILVKNLPSMKAATLVAGFDILPEPIQILGQPAVRVVFPLNRLGQSSYHPEGREALSKISEILEGHLDNNHSIETDIRRTANYLTNQIEILNAWQQVILVLETTEQFTPLNLAITRLENAIERQENYIDWRVYKESLLCLGEILHEQTRDVATDRFKELILELAPENKIKLQKALRSLQNTIPDIRHQTDTTESDTDGLFVFNQTMYANQTVNLELPDLDIQEIKETYNRLSPEYKKYLDYIRSITLFYAENLHIERLSDRIEQYRKKRSDLNERFLNKGTIFKFDVKHITRSEYTELDIAHAQNFQKFIDYANAHIEADVYDMQVSARIMPVIEAFLGIT
jgi:hypothetical protein